MINIDFSMGWLDQTFWRRVVEGFNRQNRGQVRVNYRHFRVDRYLDELRQMFARARPRIDVIGGDVIWPAEFADNDWIADLSSRFPQSERQQFLPVTIQANTFQGKVWGVPWFTDVGLLFYRKDLLGFSSPPQTWDELKQMALRVKRDSGIQHGYVFPGAQNENGVYTGLHFIWTHGGEVLDPQDPSRVIIGSSQMEAGLTTELSMIADGISPQVVDSYDESKSWDDFFQGRSVFCNSWPGFYEGIGGRGSPLSRQQVDVAPIPAGVGGQSAGCLGGFNLFINAASDAAHKDAAWQFIQFMTDAKTQKERAVNNVLLPTRKALYEDPDVQHVEIIPKAKAALDKAKTRPAHPRYSEMSAAMAEQFNFCLKGQVSPTEMAQTLQTRLSDILRRPLVLDQGYAQWEHPRPPSTRSSQNSTSTRLVNRRAYVG
jgi:multiple sugar transport system substrate-binding protein